MVAAIDIKGQQFGRLTVLEREGSSKTGLALWKCVCICGNIRLVTGGNLRSGHSTSCGCLTIESTKKSNTTHGKYGSRNHITWRNMINRCYNPKDKKFEDYGGRGITVCERWLEPSPKGFLNFYEDMGEAPKGMTLDRINVNGNYSPDNCRWASISIQSFNTRIQKNNTSGRTGVYWSKEKRKWIARIRINKKESCLGIFLRFEDAVKAREEAELKYYGFVKE